MSKIYLVSSGDYSSYGIVAVFSTEERANEFCELSNDFCVEEYEIDPEYGKFDVYYITMLKDGSLMKSPYKQETIFPISPEWSVIPQTHFDKKNKKEIIDFFFLSYAAICKSEEQAIKAANEVRTQLIALDRWNDRWNINDNS